MVTVGEARLLVRHPPVQAGFEGVGHISCIGWVGAGWSNKLGLSLPLLALGWVEK